MDIMQPVGDWVSENFSRAAIFESFGIDFCCGGKRPLKVACEERGIDVKTVLQILSKCEQEKKEIDYRSLSLSALCDHIEKSHHAYLREKLPFIQKLLKKIVVTHGQEYVPLLDRFNHFMDDLLGHMETEEKVVFPKIRAKEEVASACEILEKEHVEAKEALEFFRNFTNGYMIPEGACMTHKTAFLELEVLEKDMHLHVYKENYLLFKQASNKMS